MAKTKLITNFEIKPLRIQTANFFFITVSLLMFSFLTSCEEHGLFRESKWVGVINNDTDYPIFVNAYSKAVKLDSFSIKPRNKLTRDFTERELGFTEGIFYFPEGPLNEKNRLIDSVVIVFGENKKIVQYCDGQNIANCDNISKNLVSLWNQRNQIVDKDGNLLFGYLYKYQIAFTKEDYNSAVPF